MVEIRYPPPTRNITPQFQELKPGMTLQRIKEDPASRITYLSEEEWKRNLIYDSNHWN
jgi:hypothetical protein